jgi:hypothetical protein
LLVSALSLLAATASTVQCRVSEVDRVAPLKSRELQQASVATLSPVVAYVKDADELVYALENSATDIELQAHVDLRDVEVDLAFDDTVLPAAIDKMRSLRVRFPLGRVYGKTKSIKFHKPISILNHMLSWMQ